MNQFEGSHILSVNQLDLDSIQTIFNVAHRMMPYALREKRTKVLEGAILGNLFFEPSTRTRVSFGCAFNLLGGEVRETTGVASQCGKCACLAKQVVRETLTQLQTAQVALPYSAEFTHA